MSHADDAHGLRVQLATALKERDEAIARERGQMAAVLHTIGGEVEGHPTSAIDYLQRLRALVAIEKAFADTRPMVASAKYMVEKARDCERAESERDALRAALENLSAILDFSEPLEAGDLGIADPSGINAAFAQARAALASGGDRG